MVTLKTVLVNYQQSRAQDANRGGYDTAQAQITKPCSQVGLRSQARKSHRLVGQMNCEVASLTELVEILLPGLTPMGKNNSGQSNLRKRSQFCVQRDPLGKRIAFVKKKSQSFIKNEQSYRI